MPELSQTLAQELLHIIMSDDATRLRERVRNNDHIYSWTMNPQPAQWPAMFRSGAKVVAWAAYFDALEVFFDIMEMHWDPGRVDGLGRNIAHYVVGGGQYRILDRFRNMPYTTEDRIRGVMTAMDRDGLTPIHVLCKQGNTSFL